MRSISRRCALALAALATLGSACTTVHVTQEGERVVEDRPVRLWPLVYSARLASGAKRTTVLELAHVTTTPEGEVASWHAGPYFRGSDWEYLFPFYHAREGGDLTLAPLYFRRKNFGVAPPLLSWWSRDERGARTQVVTPFFHRRLSAEGGLRSLHAGPFYMYRDERSEKGWSHGVFPLYAAGPGLPRQTHYVSVPPAQLARVEHRGGATTTAITPFFHRSADASGRTLDLHVFNYFQGPRYRVFFPVTYSIGPDNERHQGLVPLWFRGPGYWNVPPLLTGRWKGKGGADTLFVTPLFHRTRDAEGKTRTLHILNYFQGPGYRVLFPLAYSVGPDNERHQGFIPAWFRGPGYHISLPKIAATPIYHPLRERGDFVSAVFLSGRWRADDGGRWLWLTPLFHRKTAEDGSLEHTHAFIWFRHVGQDGKQRSGFFPFYFGGSDRRIVPPLLSGWRRSPSGAETLVVTPLFHRTLNPDGSLRRMHAMTYFEGQNYKVLAPFGYSIGQPGAKHQAFFPFFFWGPDYVKSPLSGRPSDYIIRGEGYVVSPIFMYARWRREDGSKATWFTPFHHTVRESDGRLRTMHFFNIFRGQDYTHVLPIYYRWGDRKAVFPVYWRSPERKVVFPFYWRGPQHRVVFPFVAAGPDYFNVLPFTWTGPKRRVMFPLLFQGEGYSIAPPLLSGRWTAPGGERTTMVTPLFHRTTDADGNLRHMHVVNYVQWKGGRAVLPFWYSTESGHQGVPGIAMKGPGYWTIPPLLTWAFRDGEGKLLEWYTPLFSRVRSTDGVVREWRFANYLHGPDYRVFAPLAYRVDNESGRHWGLIPVWFGGPGYWGSPPFFIGSWIHNGNRRLWITPLFHRSVDSSGKVTSSHFLNYYYSPRTSVFFPVYWRNVEGRTTTRTVPFIVRHTVSPSGVKASILMGLARYERSEYLSNSTARHVHPFYFQRAKGDFEFAFLWRFPHVRREAGSTRLTVWPVWWSERPEKDKPASFQVLGGLFARDCYYEHGYYRYRLLWFIPVGARRHYAERSSR